MKETALCFATEGGILVEWEDDYFELNSNEAYDLLPEIISLNSGFEEQEDDFMAKVWVGKSMIRYEDKRFPFSFIGRNGFQLILDNCHHIISDECSSKQVHSAMSEIIKNLGLGNL